MGALPGRSHRCGAWPTSFAPPHISIIISSNSSSNSSGSTEPCPRCATRTVRVPGPDGAPPPGRAAVATCAAASLGVKGRRPPAQGHQPGADGSIHSAELEPGETIRVGESITAVLGIHKRKNGSWACTLQAPKSYKNRDDTADPPCLTGSGSIALPFMSLLPFASMYD